MSLDVWSVKSKANHDCSQHAKPFARSRVHVDFRCDRVRPTDGIQHDFPGIGDASVGKKDGVGKVVKSRCTHVRMIATSSLMRLL